MSELPPLPIQPNLHSALLHVLGEYGMARYDRCSEAEIAHRYSQTIAAIHAFARLYAADATAQLRARIAELEQALAEQRPAGQEQQ